MIKLYNFSKISDSTLLPVLKAAKAAVRCPGDVVVKVTRGGSRSEARMADYVSKSVLSSRSHIKYSPKGVEILRKGWVKTDGGYIVLSPRWFRDPIWGSLNMAEYIFENAMHEFAHIREFIEKDKLSKMPFNKEVKKKLNELKFSGYNRPWKFRPHERRAVAATIEAQGRVESDWTLEDKIKLQDCILDLAIEIDEKRKR